ncbi:helix-turn-helix transcriptional regulator [Variovorax robiniae]|uniref:Shikimate kinase n=1 Tax=Variovorax robiniae TaxID=1836199 RepID=A0ABU8XHM8_9BURK
MNDRSAAAPLSDLADERSPYLDEFGERLRTLRSRRGVTRKELALASAISERYLANLELGRANPSLLILDQVAHGLDCSIAELVGDVTTLTPEWLLLRDLLGGRSESELHVARLALTQALGAATDGANNLNRVALIGLRGAGKSTLGRMLAAELGVTFIELSTEIEQLAGYSIREIHDLYGQNAYRRYERRALEQTLQIHSDFVMATPGGMVAEPATFSVLLSHCRTVWLRAKPEDHMSRVARQGDLQPMAGNEEAMDDLRRILTGREAFYAKADTQIDTSAQPLEQTLQLLRDLVQAGR